MTEVNKVLTENDTVFDVVTKYPEAKKRLLGLSPKYERLNNPVVFHTVAKITTLKKAASVGGIYWKEFVYQLNDAIGLGREYLEKSKADAFAAHGKPAVKNSEGKNDKESRLQWMEKTGAFEVMDVRGGGEPFEAVSEKAKSLKSGEGFALVQTFEPLPLIGYLETLGFEHVTDKTGDAEVRVYFYKP